MDRKPIYSVLQRPPGVEEPIPFLYNVAGKLGHLQQDLEWRLFDFCRIHQIVYREIDRIDQDLNALSEEYLHKKPAGEVHDESAEILWSRVANSVYNQDTENRRVVAFVDQITVVGLWAIGEQFLAGIYRSLRSQQENCRPEDIQAPYRWDDFLSAFAVIGVALSGCLNFRNADECRVLNNAIKHDPAVSHRLAEFDYFRPYSGRSLIDVPLEMQRYVNGVSDFLGSLIEKANSLVA